MSNRYHNMWHRHNHHTDPTINEANSSHDPIASHNDPFDGDFVINPDGSALSAKDISTNTIIPFSGTIINFPYSVLMDNLTTKEIVLTDSTIYALTAAPVGIYLTMNINGTALKIPLYI